MQDRPNLDELLAGVESFLKKQVAPALDHPLYFHALVAANLLAIARRELAGEPEALERELAGLQGLMPDYQNHTDAELVQRVAALNKELSQLIRQGAADKGPLRRRVLKHLANTLEDKLKISNPAMAEVAGELY
ncbi:MAG: hypothetical protein KQI62_21045 [Deltaproteobacteria bacterium]|nr:hypothetical protein [Deltaproteobacteria bacterium]